MCYEIGWMCMYLFVAIWLPLNEQRWGFLKHFIFLKRFVHAPYLRGACTYTQQFDNWQFKQLQCLLVTKPLLSWYLIVKFLSYVLLPLCLGLAWFLIGTVTHDWRLPGLNGELWKSVPAWEARLPLKNNQNMAIMHDKNLYIIHYKFLNFSIGVLPPPFVFFYMCFDQ